MPILEAIILLIVLVLLSNVCSHYIKKIPVSLIQIALGLLVALIFAVKIPLETDWFLLLFIAPLLFNDGRKFPKQELWKLRGPIFANAIILVFVTAIVGGYLIYLFVPRIPLPVAIALAAILSPTDPVAVQSIAKRAKLDDNILHLVSGESLINDASGLIGFKYAVAAVTTCYFSLTQAAGDFLYTAGIGLIAGVAVMFVIQLVRDFLRNQGINDVIFNVAYKIMTPFVVYLVVEELFHASGVIAVVSAGIVSNTYSNTQVLEEMPELLLVTEKTWDIIVYLLNGIVFVILGIELPIAMTDSLESGDISNWTAFLDVIIAWLVLLSIRVIWILIYESYRKLKDHQHVVSVRSAFLAGISGVRGAITMAGVLSVPLLMENGKAFPERSLMLFIAAGVIILSLLVAAILLPLISQADFSFLTRGSDPEQEDLEEEEQEEDTDQRYLTDSEAKYFLMQLAVQAIEEHRREENQQAAYDLMLSYQLLMRRLQLKSQPDDVLHKLLAQEMALRQVAFEGERDALIKMLEKKFINTDEYYEALKHIDQLEKRLAHEFNAKDRWWSIKRLYLWGHNLVGLVKWWLGYNNINSVKQKRIDIETAKAAINALSKHVAVAAKNDEEVNRQAIYHLIVSYRNRIERIKHPKQKKQEVYQQQLEGLRVAALAAQRNGILQLVGQQRITKMTAQRLRTYVNYSENEMLLVSEDE